MNVNKGEYWFEGVERIQWNRFTTDAERLGYIQYAKARRTVRCNRSWKGVELMKSWKALSADERQRWVDGHFWHDESEGEEDPYVFQMSEDEPSEEEQEKDIAELDAGRQYRFVRTLLDRGHEEGPLTTSIRLYIGIDQDSTVHERIVVKVHKTDDEEEFNQRRSACALLDTLPKSGATLENLSWIYSESEDELRSYTDWCPHGTLEDVIRLYGLAEWQQDRNDQIPEPMLWLVLKSVAEAIYNMETGLSYVHGVADNAAAPNWTPKVHRDIKPENIFLKEGSDPYTSFPHPILADFDNILELSKGNETNQKWGAGTYGYIAPENNEALCNQGIDHFEEIPLSTQTDIWSLGAVLWELMHSYLGRKDMSDHRDTDTSNIVNFEDPSRHRLDTCTFQIRCLDLNTPNFTKDILNMFEMCNQSRPEQRPTAVALRRLVEEKFIRAEKCLGSFEGDVEERMDVRLREDEFRVGRRLELKRREVEEPWSSDEDEDRFEEGLNQNI